MKPSEALLTIARELRSEPGHDLLLSEGEAAQIASTLAVCASHVEMLERRLAAGGVLPASQAGLQHRFGENVIHFNTRLRRA